MGYLVRDNIGNFIPGIIGEKPRFHFGSDGLGAGETTYVNSLTLKAGNWTVYGRFQKDLNGDWYECDANGNKVPDGRYYPKDEVLSFTTVMIGSPADPKAPPLPPEKPFTILGMSSTTLLIAGAVAVGLFLAYKSATGSGGTKPMFVMPMGLQGG